MQLFPEETAKDRALVCVSGRAGQNDQNGPLWHCFEGSWDPSDGSQNHLGWVPGPPRMGLRTASDGSWNPSDGSWDPSDGSQDHLGWGPRTPRMGPGTPQMGPGTPQMGPGTPSDGSQDPLGWVLGPPLDGSQDSLGWVLGPSGRVPGPSNGYPGYPWFYPITPWSHPSASWPARWPAGAAQLASLIPRLASSPRNTLIGRHEPQQLQEHAVVSGPA